MGAARAPALALDEVTKRWPRQEAPIVDHVSLELGPGRLVAIAGRNGVGKTTLIRMVAGVIEPDEGRIHITGLDLERDTRRYKGRLGYLPAGNTGLFARLSVRRHLEYWGRVAFLPRERRRAAVERTLDAFALREIASRRVDRLSMGQRQRVRVAMAFLHEPALVLLDEPHTSLDDEGMAIVARALDDLVARGGTALWCIPSGEHPGTDFDERYDMRAGRLERA